MQINLKVHTVLLMQTHVCMYGNNVEHISKSKNLFCWKDIHFTDENLFKFEERK